MQIHYSPTNLQKAIYDKKEWPTIDKKLQKFFSSLYFVLAYINKGKDNDGE